MSSAEQMREQAESLLAPVSQAVPTGTDPREAPQYEQVRTEIAKLDSPTAPPVDWHAVEENGRKLLVETAKDLTIACYTAYAMARRSGISGLSVGLLAIDGLVDRYWDDMFPPVRRLKGRRNALEWLTTRLEEALAQANADLSDHDALIVAVDALAQLDERTRARFGDEAPSMAGLRRVLEQRKAAQDQAAAQISQPPDLGQPGPPGSTSSPPEARPSSPVGSPDPQPGGSLEPRESVSAEATENPQAQTDPVAAAAEAWLTPIPGDSPTGIDARFEPDYESVRHEVGKSESLGADLPDWSLILMKSGELLRSVSKDLVLASYFAYASLRVRGVGGLSLGLEVVAGLLDRHRGSLHPSRPRARVNAISWLVTELSRDLQGVVPTRADKATIEALPRVVEHFKTAVGQCFEGDAPSLSSLDETIRRLVLSIPEEAPPKPAVPPTRSTSSPSPAGGATESVAPSGTSGSFQAPEIAGSLQSPDDLLKFLRATGESLAKAGRLLQRADPSNPTGYRLLRAGLWLPLESPPVTDSGGKTTIRPLPRDRRGEVEAMASRGDWAGVIDESESSLKQFRYSLDLHRFTDLALANLGPSHQGARDAIAAELTSFLRRFPTLLEITAKDGTPFADDETRAWLSPMVNSSVDTGPKDAAPASPDQTDVDIHTELRRLMTSGKAQQALHRATEWFDTTGSPRRRFERRLSLAQLCLDHGETHIAQSLFVGLEQELRERDLYEWERELAVSCLTGFIRSLRATQKGGNQRAEGEREALARLALLDPMAAAKLSS